MVYAYTVEDKGKNIDTIQVNFSPACPLGTTLINDIGQHRYACAGEDLGAEVFVEPSLTEEDRLAIAFSQRMEKFADIIFGKVVAAIGDPRKHPGLLGWSEARVKKGQFFWIRSIPIGATLVPEELGSTEEEQ